MSKMHINIPASTWRFWGAKPQKMNATSVGFCALGISIAAGSTFGVFAKSLTGALSPMALVFVSELLTGFFVLFSFGFVPTIKELIKLKRRSFFPLLTFGVLAGILGPLLWFTGLHVTTVVNAALLEKLNVVILTLFAVTLLGERVSARHGLAVIATLIGAAFIALEGFTAGFSLRAGDLIILAATTCFALSSIVIRLYLKNVEPHLVLLSRSTFAILFFFLLSPFIEHPFISEVRNFPTSLVPTLIGFAFVSRFISGFSYYQAVERLPITTVSIAGPLDTIGALALSYWYLGESIEWYHFIGGGCIILGVILLEVLGAHPSEEKHKQTLKHRIHHRP